MAKVRKSKLCGTIQELPVVVEVHHEATGLVTEEELPFEKISIRGWYSYTPATWNDPPESDSEVEIDMTEQEVAAEIQKGMAAVDLGLCTRLTSIADVLSQLRELAEEAVLDNIDDYLDEGDCD